jgi:hypothetical protein
VIFFIALQFIFKNTKIWINLSMIVKTNEETGAMPELTPELLAEFHQFLAFRQVQQQQAITSVLKTTAPAPQTVTPTSSGLPAIPILKLLQATHFDNGLQKGTVRTSFFEVGPALLTRSTSAGLSTR